MRCAEREVKARYPDARVVRGMFGLVVVVEVDRQLGTGRAMWVEEAWVSAVDDEGEW